MEVTEWSRTNLIEFLKQGPCEVEFKKLDGSTRLMRCTLNESLLPSRPSASKPTELLSEYVPVQSEVINVYDLDLNDWRSFRIDSVRQFFTG